MLPINLFCCLNFSKNRVFIFFHFSVSHVKNIPGIKDFNEKLSNEQLNCPLNERMMATTLSKKKKLMQQAPTTLQAVVQCIRILGQLYSFAF
jgi:hypothetical protein